MSEPVKFTNEEMETIQGIQKKYFDIQGELGRISITKIRLNQQLEEIDKMEETNRQNYVDHQTTEKDFVDSITKKYGEGNLNPQTGVFTPNKSQ